MHYIETNKPQWILKKGEHKSIFYLVAHNEMGYLLGYVSVPLWHKWHGKPYGDIDVDCINGASYSSSGTDEDWWVGFCYDGMGIAMNKSLMTGPWMDHFKMIGDALGYECSLFKGRIPTVEDVEQECIGICKQLMEDL